MTYELIHIEGEAYVTLETISRCYECELEWVIEIYDYGLLGRGRSVDSGLAVPASILDRVATIWRLQRHQGLDFMHIEVLLGRAD